MRNKRSDSSQAQKKRKISHEQSLSFKFPSNCNKGSRDRNANRQAFFRQCSRQLGIDRASILRHQFSDSHLTIFFKPPMDDMVLSRAPYNQPSSSNVKLEDLETPSLFEKIATADIQPRVQITRAMTHVEDGKKRKAILPFSNEPRQFKCGRLTLGLETQHVSDHESEQHTSGTGIRDTTPDSSNKHLRSKSPSLSSLIDCASQADGSLGSPQSEILANDLPLTNWGDADELVGSESAILDDSNSTILNLPKEIGDKPRRILACDEQDAMYIVTMQGKIQHISRSRRRSVPYLYYNHSPESIFDCILPRCIRGTSVKGGASIGKGSIEDTALFPLPFSDKAIAAESEEERALSVFHLGNEIVRFCCSLFAEGH